MNKSIAAIVLDVDDCLIPTNGKTFPDFFMGLREIADCIKAGNNGFFPKISFCTGRDRNYVEAISFVAGLPNGWSVIESGIALFNPTTKELCMNDALSAEAKKAFDVIRKNRLPKIMQLVPELFEYPGNMVNIALERRNGVVIPIEKYYVLIREALSDLLSKGLVTVHHSRIAVDISPTGIDKASGISFLCEKTGINSPGKLLGIGDSRGDFPMLNLVGFTGCPANASEECKDLVKRKQGYISPYEYAFGVFDVIRHFMGLEKI